MQQYICSVSFIVFAPKNLKWRSGPFWESVCLSVGISFSTDFNRSHLQSPCKSLTIYIISQSGLSYVAQWEMSNIFSVSVFFFRPWSGNIFCVQNNGSEHMYIFVIGQICTSNHCEIENSTNLNWDVCICKDKLPSCYYY